MLLLILRKFNQNITVCLLLLCLSLIGLIHITANTNDNWYFVAEAGFTQGPLD